VDLTARVTEVLGPGLERLKSFAGIVTVAGLVLCGLAFVTGGTLQSFFHSYLYAYLFWFGVSSGSLGLLLLNHTVGGGWGFVIRRFLEAGARLIPWMLLLFIPVAIGMWSFKLYAWNDPAVLQGAHGHVIHTKTAWLNPVAWLVRSVIYFAILGVFAHLFNKWGAVYDERADRETFNKLNVWGGAGILIFVLTTTFVGVDWIQSLTPTWFSSIQGLLFTVQQSLSTVALMLVLWALLVSDQPIAEEAPRRYFRDLANLMLAMSMLWAYLSYSQYLIQYAGNLKEEIPWYLDRRQGGWGLVSLLLIPFHFGMPFIILLVNSPMKRDPKRLKNLAYWVIFMRFVDLFWWVAPTFRDHFTINAADLGTPLLIGGIWLFLWAEELRKKNPPVVPVHDPRFETHMREAASHG
jgi:hypothetical protein